MQADEIPRLPQPTLQDRFRALLLVVRKNDINNIGHVIFVTSTTTTRGIQSKLHSPKLLLEFH